MKGSLFFSAIALGFAAGRFAYVYGEQQRLFTEAAHKLLADNRPLLKTGRRFKLNLSVPRLFGSTARDVVVEMTVKKIDTTADGIQTVILAVMPDLAEHFVKGTHIFRSSAIPVALPVANLNTDHGPPQPPKPQRRGNRTNLAA